MMHTFKLGDWVMVHGEVKDDGEPKIWKIIEIDQTDYIVLLHNEETDTAIWEVMTYIKYFSRSISDYEKFYDEHVEI